MAVLREVVDFLDAELAADGFDDVSNNGLQVENQGKVTKICAGVDASLRFFREAERHGADMLVCHHGVSWSDSLRRITGREYSLVSFLIKRNMALYASHLPLDAHPRHGNNARLCRSFKLRRLKPFGYYHGSMIGFEGELATAMSLTQFRRRVGRVLGGEPKVLAFGPKNVRRVAVVSGDGSEEITEAARKGVDVFVTGETSLSGYNLAEDLGVNVLFGGHYATETPGVCAIAELAAKRFGLEWEFVDLGVEF